jgi:hypothetical protein
MTIRYDEQQEKQINKTMKEMGVATMSKAFIKAIYLYETQGNAIFQQNNALTRLTAELEELKSIVQSFKAFQNRLGSYNIKEQVKKEHENYRRTN